MNRLKFLVFALVALGLWGYQLSQVSGAMNAQSQAVATTAVVGAPHSVALAVEAQRSELQGAVVKLAASPAVLNPGPKPGVKVEPPGVDRFAQVRPVVTDALGEANRAKVVIALVNEAGALVAQGAAEPGAAPEGLELQPLVDAGGAGAIAAFGGAPTLFYATPLLLSDKNEVRAAGSVLVGLPILPDEKVLSEQLKAHGVSALGLAADGKLLVSAGDKGPLDSALKSVKSGSVTGLAAGAVRALGPLEFPILVGSPANLVGARQSIGSGLEVVATASTQGALQALAGYQVFAVGGLLGLVFLTIVFTILIGGAEEEGGRMVMPAPMPVPAPPRREEAPQPAALAMPEPAPEASPDDFDFPMSGPSAIVGAGTTGQAPAFAPEPPGPEADPFAAMAPPPPPPPAPPAPPPAPSYPPTRAPSQPPVQTAQAPAFQAPPPPAPKSVSKPPPPVTPFDDEDEGARTVAYPAFKPPPGGGAPPPPAPVSDPFAMAASQFSPDEASQSYEDSPDATRVAAVPQELIKQARSGASGTTGERPSIRPPTASLPKVQSVAPVGPAGGGSDEDRHFQEVFRDFVATREKCGEPADGLTFDKFKGKLLKNKEQLVAKYQCRTVRFQVYVKDGKAALKATPVKD